MARGEKIWLKRANIPLWIIQLICLLIFTAAAALALYAVERVSSDYGFSGDVEHALKYAHLRSSMFAELLMKTVALELLSNWLFLYLQSFWSSWKSYFLQATDLDQWPILLFNASSQ
jgi:hypothetical protein